MGQDVGGPVVDANDEEEARFRRFQEILGTELDAVDARRGEHGRTKVVRPPLNAGKQRGAQRPVYDTCGVALSGGGIRSAAFCLGALQSLAARRLFDRVDYLSTVSGGGYTGAAVSACMSQPLDSNQKFPFATPEIYDDEPAVGHLRDFSNYLFPRGSSSLADAVAVVLRGLATNIVFILAGMFFCAWLTVRAYPGAQALTQGSFIPKLAAALLGRHCCSPKAVWFLAWPFGFTLLLLLVLAGFLALWALLQSRKWRFLRRLTPVSDVRGYPVQIARWLIFAVVISAFLDLQPPAIRLLAYLNQLHGVTGLTAWFSAAFAPFAGIVAFFSDKLTAVLKDTSQKPGVAALLKRVTTKALIFVAAAVLPILLWLSYLWLCAFAIHGTTPNEAWPQDMVAALPQIYWQQKDAASFYFSVWLVLFLLTAQFAPNANSLHQLYRDKLSKAFVFDPIHRAAAGADKNDLVPRDPLKLSEISTAHGGPYHLINAAVNLQGSVQANRRGRNASFFLFSSKFVGSDVTDYVETPTMEKADPHLDLGAAMAISGAAVSSNMGTFSIGALAPTLALLNIRLGYWMTNPKYLKDKAGLAVLARRNISDFLKTYLFSEMFGQLDETMPRVYLTDGGHIENLGLYQLLKRHCKTIVLVDGEADPQMAFHSLAIVERYARIDLGVRIDLPFQKIAAASLAATKNAQNGAPIASVHGPHCAVGMIYYPDGDTGLLLYVKASMTGDEADYIVDYKARNPSFPHESTGDQFFSEEQFEVYRALGFHAIDGFLTANPNEDFEWSTHGALGTLPGPAAVQAYFLKNITP